MGFKDPTDGIILNRPQQLNIYLQGQFPADIWTGQLTTFQTTLFLSFDKNKFVKTN